jgi:AraC-like DNA-binding protein
MIPEGFPGQRLVVMPRPAVRAALARPGTDRLTVTDCGCYPRARSHGMSRPAGIDEAIVIICSAGAGRCRIDGVAHWVRAGQALVIPPGAPHSYRADPQDPWTIWWLHLAGRGLAAFLASVRLTAAEPIRQPADLFRAVEFVGEVLDALDCDLTVAQQLAAAGAAWHLLTVLAAAPAVDTVGEPMGTAAAVEHVRDHLRRHPGERTSVAELADRAGLSPSHFAAVFRRQVGMPVLRYLTGLRMSRARQLLDTTELAIGEISRQVGYPDAFYFSRQFRSVHQMSPLGYRRQHKG